MASLAKLLFLFLVFCSAAWVLLVFSARLLALLLSRVTGASITFHVAGCTSLRDLTLKLTKGPVESVSIGEIKLRLVKTGVGFVSGKPKLYLLISDFEIALRPSQKGGSKKSSKSKPKRPRSTSKGKGKLMMLMNMARFLSVTVRELVVKVPKAAIEIKELTFDVHKGSNSGLKVKLHLVPIYVHIYDPRLDMDPPSNFSEGDCLFAGQLRPDEIETNYAPFLCEDFWVTCEFGHDMDQGMKIRSLDIACGDLTLNLNEKMFIKTKTKSESFTAADAKEKATFDSTEANDSQKDKVSNQSIKKHIFMFPEKVSFNLPKLNVKFMHGGPDLFIENSVVGLYLNCKSQAYEDSGELTSHLDIRTGFREIHLVKKGATSVLEVLKFAIVASIDVPMQPSLPIRTEIDLKLGRTQCNLIISRLKPWLFLHMSKNKNKVLHDEKPKQERSQTSKMKALMWTCTASAPELIITVYSLNDLPLYRGGSQSSHLLANNIASKGIQVHAELGELDLQMADKNQQYLSETVFGAEINSGSLVHVPRVSLDWGHREVESHEEQDPNRWKLVLSIDITGLGVFFCFQHIESLILNMMSFKALLKGISGSGKKTTQNKIGHSSKTSSKGTQICKLNLDKCSINYCGDLSVENMIVADPKRVNFGSQGGQVLISVSADGTPRTASITSSISSDCKKLKFSVSLDIVHLNLCLNKAKHSTKVELERARSIYQEYSEDCRPSDKMTLLDMQKAKFVRRTGGLHEVAVCSLFNATDIAVGWEPDLHLALVECMILLKALLAKKKNEETDAEIKEGPVNMNDKIPEKEATVDQVQSEKQNKKRESIFAVDVEMLRVSAELADGVQAMVHVHSIFSENAKIGVLLEGLVLTFDEARIFRSSRMQISRIPISNAKAQSVTTRDWVIQGADVHICMPHRLQLRAIDDAVEDTLRALKLIASAKTNLIFPAKKDTHKKVKVKSTKFGSVRFIIRKLTADIEEEPLQGWLDEHYKLMKNEACELDVRMKFLDSVLSEGSRTAADAEPNDLCSEQKIRHNGVEIDVHDLSAVKSLYEEIHRQSFHSYYLACKKLIPSEGSGADKSGFQSGFKHSTCRDSLLLLCATELDVTLTKVEGGETGMIQFINRIDPISLDNEIPFARLYGGDFVLNTGSLVAQIRDYTYPLFAGTSGTCKGRIVLAQQATPFQPQIHQDVSVGRWWTVRLLRSASGTTPPMKFYAELPVFFQKGEVSFGVGYEPVFADISYAFTVALRRAYLGSRPSIAAINDQNQPPKKERSLPWWDDMRNYVHGKIGLNFKETKWNLHGTTDPYEKQDVLQVTSGYMDIQQTDGNVCLFTKDFKVFLSSLESLTKNCTLKPPCHISRPFLDCPAFSLDVSMDWECESGTPLNHYIFALPKEGKPREKVFDPFRSTALSLRWCFNLGSSLLPDERHAPLVTMGENATLEGSPRTSSQKLENTSIDSPTINLAAHDLAWLVKFWNLMYLPPHKLRLFSRFPRFGVPRIVRSGNLSLDRVMTEFFLRFDCTPTCIKHTPLSNDDPSSGLTFRVTKLKLEICFSRGKQLFTFDCKRDPLDLVYQGLDLHLLKVYLSKDSTEPVVPDKQTINRNAQNMTMDKPVNEKSNVISVSQEKCKDDGFLLHSDYFTIRKQTPKADATRLLSWQEAGRNSNEVSFVKSEYEDGSESEQARSDPSDDDGFNVVVADNCQRIFVYGLKILWTIENRDAVMSFAAGLSKAFKHPKPSPSRQYAQRKLFEEQQTLQRSEMPDSDASTSDSASFSSPQVEISGSLSSPSAKTDCPSSVATVRHGQTSDSEEGTRNFMVNVIQPQFNLHSEEANGRFLLAAASGRVLARSFHSVLHVGYDMIEKALGTTNVPVAEIKPEMTWKRVELSVMLEHVQAHVAPTDVDPGAGVQWLPKILRSSPKVKRTGALLERVFMPCQMYFRYTRHKGGTPELKVKPLKEVTFNSPNITAAMTSRQFQVMMDVLTNLLFARPPKPHTSSLSCSSDDDEEEEADEVVPDGIEEVELAKIDLEQEDRKRKLLLDDIRTISIGNDISDESSIFAENNADLWMISCGKSSLVRRLKKELADNKNSRKESSFSLRIALQKASQLRLIEKEKNKSPSYAMRISVKINKVGWSMLADGKSFAEAEINEMIYDFDRDYKDIGRALFTIRSLVVKNCLPNAKSDILLSAWNAPSEWGKKVMLRVNAKQGAPKDGSSPIELFQVEIYPLKIHLTETMYRMMWGYLFPGEEQDTQRRQEAWKVSTTSSSRRQKKGALVPEATSSPNFLAKKTEAPGKLSATTVASLTAGSSPHGDSSQASKSQNAKSNNIWSSTPELRRTSSFDRTWEESLAESVADELVLQANSPRVSSKSGHQSAVNEGTSKNKPKDSKSLKSSRSAQEEKAGKPQDEKRARPRKIMEFHNIKISQVELLLTYEGSRLGGIPISDLRLLMDTFHREEFTGTWTRLFSRFKKHIIWGVLKSVTGMQGKKFKAKSQSQKEKEAHGVQREVHGVVSPENDILLSDSDRDQPEKSDQLPVAWPKRPNDGAGDGFVTSIRGLFNNQRRKAKAFVLRTMRGDADNEFHGEWSESDVEFTPFARQLTITKAKKLIQRHKSKYRSRTQKSSGVALQQQDSNLSSPREMSPFQSDDSSSSSSEESSKLLIAALEHQSHEANKDGQS